MFLCVDKTSYEVKSVLAFRAVRAVLQGKGS